MNLYLSKRKEKIKTQTKNRTRKQKTKIFELKENRNRKKKNEVRNPKGNLNRNKSSKNKGKEKYQKIQSYLFISLTIWIAPMLYIILT